jgi:hypothetical protein
MLNETPPRRQVLDRETQHLQICPDSQDTVRNCQRMTNMSKVVVAAWVVAAVMRRSRVGLVPTVLVGLAGFAANALRKQFYFSKTERDRDQDLAKIPKKMWLDPH